MPYGLIAGAGRFPIAVLEAARAQGIDMVVAAIREESAPEVENYGYSTHWLGLGQLGKLIRVFRRAGVSQAIMAGQVKHKQIFGLSVPDLTMIRMLAGLKQKNTSALIGGVAHVLSDAGITLIDSTALTPHLLVPAGLLTRRDLNSREKKDVAYGRPIVQQIAGMDIGQTIVVRNQAVIAVEAMEGTDQAIRRAAELAHGKHLTVIKVSRPQQDMRFDVPVIGLPTLEVMIECGATALAVDAQRTLLFDREPFVALADQNSLAVVGMPPFSLGS